MKKQLNWFIASTRGHSIKPDEARKLIEYCYPKANPKIELFARVSIRGWDAWGLDVGGIDTKNSVKMME